MASIAPGETPRGRKVLRNDHPMEYTSVIRDFQSDCALYVLLPPLTGFSDPTYNPP